MKGCFVWMLSLLALTITPFSVDARFYNDSWGTYYLGAEFAAGRFIGIDQSYGGVSYFAVPNLGFDSVYFLLDAKAFKLERSNWAGSIGVGARYWNDEWQKAYGANFFYDHRYDRSGPFNQIGLGFEMLSDIWEFHLNGYWPFGTTGHHFGKHTQVFLGGFEATFRKRQFALRGVEFTAGARFWFGEDFNTYFAPGFYFYNNRHIGDIQGIQCNWDIGWSNWIDFRLNASYDSRFKGRVQGILYLTLPIELLCSQACCCSELIVGRPIQRNDMIFLKRCRDVERNFDDCGLPITND